MKKNIGFIAVLVAVVMVVSVTVGCKKGAEENDVGGNVVEKTDDFVVKTGTSEYSIVIPDIASSAESTAANELKVYLKNITGADIPIITDKKVNLSEDLKIYSIGNTSILLQLKSKTG